MDGIIYVPELLKGLETAESLSEVLEFLESVPTNDLPNPVKTRADSCERYGRVEFYPTVRHDISLKAYAMLLKQVPGHPAAFHYVGKILRNNGYPDQARCLFEANLSNTAANEQFHQRAHFNLAYMLLEEPYDKERAAEGIRHHATGMGVREDHHTAGICPFVKKGLATTQSEYLIWGNSKEGKNFYAGRHLHITYPDGDIDILHARAITEAAKRKTSGLVFVPDGNIGNTAWAVRVERNDRYIALGHCDFRPAKEGEYSTENLRECRN